MNPKGTTMQRIPITVRISYDVLKDLLDLPEDVEVLGIPGINDVDGCFPLIIETPPKHVIGGAMEALYETLPSRLGRRFKGFAPSGLELRGS